MMSLLYWYDQWRGKEGKREKEQQAAAQSTEAGPTSKNENDVSHFEFFTLFLKA